jgi:hypothetical protein
MNRNGGLFNLLATATCAALLLPGCTTRAKARAAEEAAFRAGQQQGALIERARQNGITFKGPVVNSIVPWHEKMTLAQAVVSAEWCGKGNPRQIILSHGDDRMEMTMEELLENGAQFPVHPGDTVELVP